MAFKKSVEYEVVEFSSRQAVKHFEQYFAEKIFELFSLVARPTQSREEIFVLKMRDTRFGHSRDPSQGDVSDQTQSKIQNVELPKPFIR
jgi:hypothetical protein